MDPDLKEYRLPNYGGQALIEGILMRGKNYVVAAFRDPDGSIHIEEEKLIGVYKTKLSRLPFLRGLIILWDSLFLGMKYLTISANLQSEDEEQIEGASQYLTLLISLTFSIGLFFLIPSLFIHTLSRYANLTTFAINFGEGIVRLIILVFYLWIIGKTKEISRVFGYHGAEHKTINAYERGINISIENVKQFQRAHTRCGTSFLLTLVLISIIIFSLLGPMPLWKRITSRILMVPIIAMISYELIKWMSDNNSNILVRTLSYPNLLLQELTTREPGEDMIEIAVAAFKRLIKLENS